MSDEITYENIKRMVSDIDEVENFEKLVKSRNLSFEEIKIIMEAIRDGRMEDFFRDLNMDMEKYDKIKDESITLSPDSIEWPLLSTLYRNHEGEYRVKDLINEYHDSILHDGITVGMDYGMKFLTEDIQNKRFSKEDILNMTREEIEEYCEEDREEI